MLLSPQQFKENNMTSGSLCKKNGICLLTFNLSVQADCFPLLMLLQSTPGYTGLCSGSTYNTSKKPASPKYSLGFTTLEVGFYKNKHNF